MNAAPTPLLNGIPAPGNSFVVWDKKIVYMSVTKVACGFYTTAAGKVWAVQNFSR